MHFTATYSDGSTGSVIPSSYTPTSFGDTGGTQTVTFSFEGTDIEVFVDYEVKNGLTVTSISITGTPTETQQVESPPDWTGCTFTYGLSDGTTIVRQGNDGLYDTFGGDLAVYDGAGINEYGEWADLSESVLDVTVADDYWTFWGYDVADPAPSTTFDFDVSEPVLESLSVSGSFTNPQYAGWNVDMTGLTFTAHYDDSSSKQVFNVATTPLMWDASGNPNNLGTQDVIFSFTEGDVTVNTGINGTVIHRPDEQDIVTGSENWAYYDYLNEWGLVKSPMEVLQGGASEGDYICGFFTESDYENHTTITPEVLMGYMGTYSVMAGEGYPDGTINTAGYVPTTGLPDLTGLSLNEKYICFGVKASSATTGTVKVVVAPAASNISAGSFSSSDFDTSDANAKVYTVNIISAP